MPELGLLPSTYQIQVPQINYGLVHDVSQQLPPIAPDLRGAARAQMMGSIAQGLSQGLSTYTQDKYIKDKLKWEKDKNNPKNVLALAHANYLNNGSPSKALIPWNNLNNQIQALPDDPSVAPVNDENVDIWPSDKILGTGTSYGYNGDPYGGPQSKASTTGPLGNKLDEYSLAASPDVEQMLKQGGVSLGDWITVHTNKGDVLRRFDDRTAQDGEVAGVPKLRGRWDFHAGVNGGISPYNGAQILGFSKAKPQADNTTSIPIDLGNGSILNIPTDSLTASNNDAGMPANTTVTPAPFNLGLAPSGDNQSLGNLDLNASGRLQMSAGLSGGIPFPADYTPTPGQRMVYDPRTGMPQVADASGNVQVRPAIPVSPVLPLTPQESAWNPIATPDMGAPVAPLAPPAIQPPAGYNGPQLKPGQQWITDPATGLKEIADENGNVQVGRATLPYGSFGKMVGGRSFIPTSPEGGIQIEPGGPRIPFTDKTEEGKMVDIPVNGEMHRVLQNKMGQTLHDYGPTMPKNKFSFSNIEEGKKALEAQGVMATSWDMLPNGGVSPKGITELAKLSRKTQTDLAVFNQEHPDNPIDPTGKTDAQINAAMGEARTAESTLNDSQRTFLRDHKNDYEKEAPYKNYTNVTDSLNQAIAASKLKNGLGQKLMIMEGEKVLNPGIGVTSQMMNAFAHSKGWGDVFDPEYWKQWWHGAQLTPEQQNAYMGIIKGALLNRAKEMEDVRQNYLATAKMNRIPEKAAQLSIRNPYKEAADRISATPLGTDGSPLATTDVPTGMVEVHKGSQVGHVPADKVEEAGKLGWLPAK